MNPHRLGTRRRGLPRRNRRWWVLYIGVALGVVALVGWVFEFSRGQHAH